MPVVTICLVISNNLLLVLEDAPKRILFPHELAIFWSAKQRRKNTRFRDKYFCREKYFFTTNTCLSRQNFCRDKHTFDMTKDVFCRDKNYTCGCSRQ